MNYINSVPCYIMRGGTSKGLFFYEQDIPKAQEERDQLLLRIMGSPDPKQIDGLGGATSVTSKVAIISKSSREDADVNYTFAQVAIDKRVVDYKGNCGNILSAVGPFAIETGLLEAKEPVTVVRIFNTNTQKVIHAEVQVKDGRVVYEGDYEISGVPGTAAPVKLSFYNPSGSVTGKLLPTGNPIDKLVVPGLGEVEVSIVDAANPLVFVKAEDVGMKGTELPDEIDGSPELLERLERVRATAAVRLGFVERWEEGAAKSPAVPKMTIMARAKGYMSADSQFIDESKIDLIGRMMSMQKTHKTYALTGALCTGVAAVLPGTVVNALVKTGFEPNRIRIGHPGGIIETGVMYEENNGSINIICATGYRTARLLMVGKAYY